MCFINQTRDFFEKIYLKNFFFSKKKHEKWPKFDDFFKKKKFFGKIFWKKSRVWFIKHQGVKAKSKFKKNFFFEKFPKNAKI